MATSPAISPDQNLGSKMQLRAYKQTSFLGLPLVSFGGAVVHRTDTLAFNKQSGSWWVAGAFLGKLLADSRAHPGYSSEVPGRNFSLELFNFLSLWHTAIGG